jgi:DNA repair exonuclease SbcCD ATPase subunit
MNLREIRSRIEQLKGSREELQRNLETTEGRLENNRIKLGYHEQAREIIRAVGLRTQEQLQFHISDITSLALEAVYPDPYKLIAEFVQRRNKTECDLLFERNGQRIEPMDSSGGGTVNIASFALRVASWSMENPRSNNVLILDEPFGNISVDLLPRASQMLREISDKLKLQMIMVTHSEELMECADRTFRVTKNSGESTVQQIGEGL